jgi:hypothetical protein
MGGEVAAQPRLLRRPAPQPPIAVQFELIAMRCQLPTSTL